ncbi:nucleotidyl transferase AbiEii/AbiGii toxin family protein [Mesorhizobium sp.]|uniref:nucleotidyl transferase AbiEii/AbiGii toxin family protein n=1 Tax=Mesorhizobium sp. TaxID=1871066 RepID=UPI00345CA888
MLFAAWLDNPFRPTRDLDLLGRGDAGVATMVECFRAICSTPVHDDGVEFDAVGLTAEPIRDETEYAGVRVRTAATIAGARVPIQVDVGFDDVVTPAPVELEYPTLLDSPPPRLRAYPPETVIAEKFEALASLGVANSRMKDFYDLWMIARTFSFEGTVLSFALRRTFERRQTAWPAEIPAGLGTAFAAAKSGQWRAFLTRERVVTAPGDFATIIDGLRAFLAPLLSEGPHTGQWPPGGPWTE